MINTIKSDILNERYETITLENGLRIACYTMPKYNGVHAIIGTNFGSIDRKFTMNGEKFSVPAGVAHFLEHKMFEKEEGDVFSLYAKTGANANAFTSFDKTCYIFTATSEVDKCLDILLHTVNSPYFTKETVEKEQGIIAQEIKMYDDNAYWRMLFGVLNGLYINHSIKDDIAGTVESISKITHNTLYDCTKAFYSPGQMILCVAGNITIDEVIKACERAEFKQDKVEIEKTLVTEPNEVNYKEKTIYMPISAPLVAVGFKEVFEGGSNLKNDLISNIILDVLTGSTSDLFNDLYDKNLVNGTFSGEVISGEDYFSFIISGETQSPDILAKELENAILSLKKSGVTSEEFKISKNSLYGSLIVDFENVEEVAGNIITAHFRNYTAYDQIETLKEITLEDVNNQLLEMFNEDRKTVFTVMPINEENK